MSELKRVLECFDMPQVCEAACRMAFGQSRHFAFPSMIKGAFQDGYLESRDDEQGVSDSVRVYCRFLVLTDKGREFCGLPLVAKPKPKPSVDSA